MDAVACPACTTPTPSSPKWRFHDPDGFFPDPLPLVECPTCRLVFLSGKIDASPLYATGYYGKKRGLPSLFFEPFNRFWVNRKAAKMSALLPGKSLLDFGCGRGDFLLAMKERGYDVWGLETQPEAIAFLQTELGTHAVNRLDDLPDHAFLNGITLWHVLEHLQTPGEILSKLAKRAKPGAVLFVAVPNWNSYERRWFGERWFHADVPRHCLQFMPDSLTFLLTKNGWTVKSMHFNSWPYNLFGLFQSILNLGPGPRNLFYRVCKRGALPAASWMSLASGILWNVVMIGPAALCSLVLIGPMTAMQKTGTVEVIALKG